jgi:hypothetical protein
MKGLLVALMIALALPSFAQDQNQTKKEPPTLKSILLEQLR